MKEAAADSAASDKPVMLLGAENDKPSITVRVSGQDGVWATEDAAANTIAYPSYRNGFATAVSSTEISYENLVPGESYNVKVIAIAPGGEDSSESFTFAASQTGSGTWTANTPISAIWSYDFTGENIIKVTATPKSGEESIESTIADGDKSSTVYVHGIASMEISASNGTNRDNLRYIAPEEIDDSTVVSGKIVLKGLKPNSSYTITSRVSKFEIDSYPDACSNVSADVSRIETTDADGTVTFEIDYNVDKSQLEVGYYYINRFSVKQSESPRSDANEYSFLTDKIIFENLILSPKSRLYVLKDHKPAEKPTTVDVEVSNTKAGTHNLISGSNLKIVKGDSADGEEVESWTQSSESHHVSLELGTYTLVQIKAPDGYILADPVVFTVSAQDAKERGYNYEAEEGKSDGAFYIRRDNSDDTPEVVFCINAEKDFGARIDEEDGKLLYYTEYDLKDAQLNNIIGNNRLSSLDDLRAKLLQIVYAGYPNDKAGLKAKYKLTDSELNLVTQNAIHYYTDSVDFSYSGGTDDDFPSQDAYDAYLKLINTNIKTPAGMTVKIYMPTNDYYQSLISTYFRDENPVMKLVIENQKPDEPDKDKPDEVKPEEKKENKKPVAVDSTSKEAKKSKSKTVDTADHNLILPSALSLGFATASLLTILRRRMKKNV